MILYVDPVLTGSLGYAHAEVLPRVLQTKNLPPPSTHHPKLYALIKPAISFTPRTSFIFLLLPHQSAQTHLHEPGPCFSPHASVVYAGGPIGCWNIRRVATCSLVKSLEQGQGVREGSCWVGFWTQHDPRKIGFGTKVPIMLYSIARDRERGS